MAEKNRKNEKQEMRRRQRNRRVLFAVVFCTVFLIAGLQIWLTFYLRNHDNGKILQGVYVGNTDVSGLSEKDALKAVQGALAGYAKEKIILEQEEGKQIEITLEEVGLSVSDVPEAVTKAFQRGRSGGLIRRYQAFRKAEKKENIYRIPLKYEVDKGALADILIERAGPILDSPVNAAVSQENGSVVVIPGQDGEVPDVDTIFAGLKEFLNKDWNGKGVSFNMAVKSSRPAITEEDLKDVTALLGSYTTYYGADGSGRAQNVESGARHLNGILLRSGESLSANEMMGPYTVENGYAQAASYAGNTVVESMGGGICQVSTTLYNALLYAEVEIVERCQHSMLVSYVEPSMDAAIAEDLLDLVFKNNQETPIYIQSMANEGSLTFYIYGKETRDPGRTLQFISETTGIEEPQQKQYVAADYAIGYMEVQSAARPQITAQLWKVVYQNGEEQSREIINYSQYMSAPETVAVGVLSSDPASTEKMNLAIQTQDESQIQAAIQEILYGVPEIQEEPQSSLSAPDGGQL